ncbi:MAG: hypothetical protein J3Q66DRAFT_324387 [Benniella sp.]|nr:MAG: hypothetical protein J3Q66DRAFT_324387 [Benniella sp.]
MGSGLLFVRRSVIVVVDCSFFVLVLCILLVNPRVFFFLFCPLCFFSLFVACFAFFFFPPLVQYDTILPHTSVSIVVLSCHLSPPLPLQFALLCVFALLALQRLSLHTHTHTHIHTPPQ